MLPLLLGVLLVAWLIYATKLKGLLSYWSRRGVPGPKFAAPLGDFTDAIFTRKSVADVSCEIYEKYRNERYVGTQFLTTPLLHIHDPEIIRHVFVKEFTDFNGRGMYSDPERDPLSGHLFILSGTPWRNMRVKLSPTFTTGKMKYMFSTIKQCGDQLRQHVKTQLSAGGGAYEEDVKELISRFGTDIITSVAFGVESNTMQNPKSEIRRMGQLMMDPSLEQGIRGMLTFFWPRVMMLFGIRAFSSEPTNFFLRTVREMVEYREKNKVERADMLNLLIKLKNEGFVPPDSAAAKQQQQQRENGPRDPTSISDLGVADGSSAATPARQMLTVDEIAAQCLVFFLAGFETTSGTLTFLLYLLAKNPHIQDKVVEELQATLDKHGGEVTYDTLMDMPYIDMVINESLRLYPAVPWLTREAMRARNLPLTDLKLEKGQRLLIPVRALHMDPKYWENPKEFNPERFTKEMEATRHPMTFMPFGDGPRICIGMRMAMVQVKMALLTILSEVKVSLTPNCPLEIKLAPESVTPTPAETLKIVFSARG